MAGGGPQDQPGSGGGGITPPAGDIGGTTGAPTVVGFEGIPLDGPINPGQAWELDGAGTGYVPFTPSAGGGITPPAGDIGGTTGAPTVIGFEGVPLSGGPLTAGQGWVANAGATALVPASLADLLIPTAKTASASIAAWQLIIDNSTVAPTYTTPATMPPAGTPIGVSRGSNTTTTVTLIAAAGQTVCGKTSVSASNATLDGQSIVLVSDGISNWYALATVGSDWGLGIVTSASFNTNGNFNVGGQFRLGQLAQGGNYTILGSDRNVAFTGAAPATFTFGTALQATLSQMVLITNNGTAALTLACAGTGTINGAATYQVPIGSAVWCAVEGAGANPVIYVVAATLPTPGAAGTVLTGNGVGSAPSYQAPASQFPLSTPVAGTLATDYAVTTAPATFLTTASLAVGTWLVTLFGVVTYTASGTKVEGQISDGTATATFAGVQSFSVGGSSTTTPEGFGLFCLVTVTVAGTLVFTASGATSQTIKANTPVNGYAGVTGYTAVRVA